MIREMIDTYIVTSGYNYNLQVWNRYPSSNLVLVKYTNGETIRSKDIRLVFIKIDTEQEIIDSVIILAPKYIENRFGKFGKPTIKHQLLILPKQREEIIKSKNSILWFPDTDKISKEKYLSINEIKERVVKKLIGKTIEVNDTKSRGQALERIVWQLLGYDEIDLSVLEGGYPDIPPQLLEVKVQDSPTVDLGKYSPEFEDIVIENSNITTADLKCPPFLGQFFSLVNIFFFSTRDRCSASRL